MTAIDDNEIVIGEVRSDGGQTELLVATPVEPELEKKFEGPAP